LNNEPSRGFAGQLYFFPRDGEEPIQVDGDVRIYVFDDQGSKKEQVRPLHQFDFSPEAWNTYLYNSQFGPCYQLFIPYTREGHKQAECVVRLRYKPKSGGPTVYTKLVDVKLPGVTDGQDTKPLVERIERRDSPKMEGSTIKLASKQSIKDHESNYREANVERAQEIIHSKLQQMATEAKVDTQVKSLAKKSRATRVHMKPANNLDQAAAQPAPFVLDLTSEDDLRHIDEANNPSTAFDYRETSTTTVEHPLTAESFKQSVNQPQRHPLLDVKTDRVQNTVPVEFEQPVRQATPVLEHPLRKHPLEELEDSTSSIKVPTATLPEAQPFTQPTASQSSLAATSSKKSSFWKLRPAADRTPQRLSRESAPPAETIETFDFDDPSVTHVQQSANSDSRDYAGVRIDETTPDADFVERSSQDKRRFRSLAR